MGSAGFICCSGVAYIFIEGDEFQQGAAVEVGGEQRFGAAGQVDGIVPVSKAEERQTVGTYIAAGESHGAA